MAIYTYSKNNYNFIQLLDEVYSAITKQLYAINDGDATDGYADANGNQINFILNNPLSEPEQTSLNDTVVAHIPNPNYTNASIDNIKLPKSNFMTNSLTASTISGGTIYGDGGNLKGIKGAFGITIDNGANVISAGQKGFLVAPYDLGIVGWDVVANTSGSCAIDLWKNTTIPTIANTITGTQKPQLSGTQTNTNPAPLNTWTTGVTQGDIIAFNVISATTISRVTLTIRTIKK